MMGGARQQVEITGASISLDHMKLRFRIDLVLTPNPGHQPAVKGCEATISHGTFWSETQTQCDLWSKSAERGLHVLIFRGTHEMVVEGEWTISPSNQPSYGSLDVGVKLFLVGDEVCEVQARCVSSSGSEGGRHWEATIKTLLVEAPTVGSWG